MGEDSCTRPSQMNWNDPALSPPFTVTSSTSFFLTTSRTSNVFVELRPSKVFRNSLLPIKRFASSRNGSSFSGPLLSLLQPDRKSVVNAIINPEKVDTSCFFIFLFFIFDYPFMHLLYSQLLVCQRVCLQNTVC